MANITKQFPVDATTSDTNYRLWGGGINSMLTNLGFVQTNDTGQVNWTTATATGSAASYWHYEVWRFNDSLQATAPIVFKTLYGKGNNTSTALFGIDVGTGSNGSGVITGFGSSSVYNVFWGHINSDSGYKSHLGSSDNSGLTLVHGIDASTPGHKGFLVLDRTRNADGTPNNSGASLRLGDSLSAPGFIIFDRQNNTRYSSPGGNALMPMVVNSGQSSVQKNGNFPVAPIHILIPGVNISKSKMAVVYTAADIGLNGTFRINHQGALRAYRCLGSSFTGQDSSGSSTYSLAVWWND